MIVQSGDKWCVKSEDGSRSFGCYDTEEQAKRRLGQVESYKAEQIASVVAAKALAPGDDPVWVFPVEFFDEDTSVVETLSNVDHPWFLELPTAASLSVVIQKNATVFLCS